MKARFDREAQTIAGLNHPHICENAIEADLAKSATRSGWHTFSAH
jgi:hypothetical protein